MSVANFIPELWSKKILKELDKQHMLVKNCSTTYSGEITGIGSKVKINSIDTPTIETYTPNSTTITPAELVDSSRMLEITESKYFAFYLDDVDAKQGTGGMLEEGLRKAVVGLKDLAEQFVATKFLLAENTVTEAALTSANVMSTMMDAKVILMANNVGMTDMVLEVTPYIWGKMGLGEIAYTDTGKMINKGQFSTMLGMTVYVSNNLTVTGSGSTVKSMCVMRTKEAIGYAEQIMKTVKYMPENGFKEAIKGLHVYGAKEIKTSEMVNLELTNAAETTI